MYGLDFELVISAIIRRPPFSSGAGYYLMEKEEWGRRSLLQ